MSHLEEAKLKELEIPHAEDVVNGLESGPSKRNEESACGGQPSIRPTTEIKSTFWWRFAHAHSLPFL